MGRIEKEKHFLEGVLGNYSKDDLLLASWQNRVIVKNPEVFNKIAESAKIHKIKEEENHLHFTHDLSGIKNSTDTWVYELIDGKEEFLKKYGNYYIIL